MSGTGFRRGLLRIVALGWRVALLLAVAGVVVTELLLPPEEFHVHPYANAIIAGSPPADPARPALPTYSADTAAILAQPLFYPTRRPWTPPPAPVAAPVVVTPPPLTAYTLLGVIGSGTSRSALIRPASSGKTITLSEGQQLEGWTLREIRRDGLRFAAGDASYDMVFAKPSEARQ